MPVERYGARLLDDRGTTVRDALKSYLALAGGVTDLTRQAALTAARALVSQGEATAEQVTTLAEDLLAQTRQNREAVVALVRSEVDRALARVGLASADEVEELTRRIRELEALLQGQVAAASPGVGAAGGEASAEQTPVAPAPATRGRTEGAPAERAPRRKAPAKRASAEQTPGEKATAGRAPAKAQTAAADQAPKKAPAKAPAKKAPAKRARAKEAPVDETGAAASSSTTEGEARPDAGPGAGSSAPEPGESPA